MEARQSAADFERELAVAAAAATAAGAVVRDLYERAAATTYTKGDGSLVTDADLAADRAIRDALTAAFPADAILTEEGVDDDSRLGAVRCWLVDPIDGTNQFVDRTGEFDVLIALAVDGRPVVGVLYQPTTDTLLTAAIGRGAWIERGGERRPLRFAPVPTDAPPRLMTSIWLGAPANLPLLERTAARLGGGTPIVSPLGVTVRRFVPPGNSADALIGLNAAADLTMAWEWDFAAAEVVVHEAGGRVSDVRGNPHRYNKPVPRNVGGILLSVDPTTHARILAALRPELTHPTGSGRSRARGRDC
jgi:3'-phosphoadenosine 5'-phosphosulfate (PAPS) 3'-phosphatase